MDQVRHQISNFLSEQTSKNSKGQFEKFCLEHKQMLRVGAVDCEESKELCKKNDISGELPLYRIYPEMPIPAVDVRT